VVERKEKNGRFAAKSDKYHNTEPQNHTFEGEILLKTIERFVKKF
jgi:hypothetical protein